jgi:hypothetical protein
MLALAAVPDYKENSADKTGISKYQKILQKKMETNLC